MATATKTRKARHNDRRSREDVQFSERVRFNHGYHDAYAEFEMGLPRTLVVMGQHSTTTVSREFCPWYYDGYAAGIQDAASDVPHTLSSAAWTRTYPGRAAEA